MKKAILFLFALFALSFTQAQTCPGALICNTSTLQCWDVGNWDAGLTVGTISAANPYTPYISVSWTALAGAVSYNLTWIQEAHMKEPTICNLLAHSTQSCLRKITYGLKTTSGIIGGSPYNFNGSGYYYAVQAVMADNSIVVCKLGYAAYKNQSCQGCQDICPSALSSYAAMPWPPEAAPPAATEPASPGKKK